MSETATPPGTQQQLVVNIQYVKDMSFEVPGAPAIYTQLKTSPQVNINLDVQARRIQDNQHVYEVTLMIRAEAHQGAAPAAGTAAAPPGAPLGGAAGGPAGGNGQNGGAPAAAFSVGGVPPTVFVAELAYAGVFTLSGLPENTIEPVLLVECPRILFPFARNILADVTRDGGFPPVLLQPIDFVQLWQSRRAQQGQPTATA